VSPVPMAGAAGASRRSGLVRCRLRALALLGGLASLAACGPPPPPVGLFPDQRAGDLGGLDLADEGGAGDLGEADAATGDELLDPRGGWIFWRQTATCVNVLGIGFELLADALSIVELEDLGGGLVRARQRFCQLQQTPVLGLATSASPSLAESIPVADWHLMLAGRRPGDPFQAQDTLEIWGMNLGEPATEELPTTPDDPRVYDMDGDGKPGATLVLGQEVCELYVVQRGFVSWSGQIASPIRLAGGGTNRSTQVVLDTTSGFCATQYDVRYLDDRNHFVMLRADGQQGAPDADLDDDGRISCAEARAFGLAPFSPPTVDDSHCQEP